MTHINAGRIIKQLSEQWNGMPDKRKASNAQVYKMKDAVLSALGVFYTQCPSFLARQRDMGKRKGRSNAHSLFRVSAIPSDAQTRNMLDTLDESYFGADYEWLHEQVRVSGRLEAFRDVGNTYLIGLDGTDYFSSTQIHCEHCLERKDNTGQIHYRHGAIVPVLVKPGWSDVLALMPEMIVNQDGQVKQDCEQNAAKRWLSKQHFAPNSVTILGDDLYAHEPLCRQISLESQQSFIFVAKPDSHVYLYEWLDYSAKINAIEQWQERRWNGRHHELWRYRWINQAPLCAASDALRVNWLELTITHADSAAILYHNTWITNHLVGRDNLAQIADAGRARWKNENESHNVLKKHGYHIDHNFGHGDQHLAAVLFSLNVLAFLIHTVQQLIDTPYQLLRAALKTRQTFFDDLRALLRYQLFSSWEHLFIFMFDGLEIVCPPDLLSSP
jgi:hypothetical protein